MATENFSIQGYRTEQQFLQSLKEDTLLFPPLQIRPVTSEVRHHSTLDDGLLDISWRDRSFRFIYEVKLLSTPKSLEGALRQVRSISEGTSWLPLIVVPFLSEESLDWLEREGISGIDFNGNGFVVTPDFFVRRTGKSNQFPSSQPIQNVFRGNSSLLARSFLLQGDFSTSKDLRSFALGRLYTRYGTEKNTLLSKGTVSKVVQALLEETILVRTADRIRLAAPELLLERLRANYTRSRGRRLEGKIPFSMLEAWGRLSESEVRYIATGDGSATRYNLLSSDGKLSLYVDDLQKAADILEVKESRVFPNVLLIEEGNDTFYFDRRMEGAACWASPIQTWLELSQAGPREREVAHSLETALIRGEAGALL